uniref:Uncharacterized protein n=2 Tax=Candidatus Kentrum sp. TUN TaxID=2126343 RepID=A0A451B1I4_9GAMM|nr:MAG: hypothetical protein BECKTUN1418E_GA0071001_13562 [Candidatus Kentron sp. TUN]
MIEPHDCRVALGLVREAVDAGASYRRACEILGSSGFSVPGFGSALFCPRGYVYQPRVAAQQLLWEGNAQRSNPNGVASFPDVLLVPFQTVFSKKGSVFVLEAPFFVMFFLIGDVFSDRVQIGFADRKRTVSALPSKSR